MSSYSKYSDEAMDSLSDKELREILSHGSDIEKLVKKYEDLVHSHQNDDSVDPPPKIEIIDSSDD